MRPFLILASSSFQRRQLLEQIGVFPDRIIAPGVDETPKKSDLPPLHADRMAKLKASSIDSSSYPNALILAADTVVAAGRRILEKPRDRQDAETMLRLLSGRRHRVITTVVARLPDGSLRHRRVVSIVMFKRLHPTELSGYLDTGEWQEKAGSYAIQGRASAFVTWIRGSYSGIVGLPLAESRTLLCSADYPC